MPGPPPNSPEFAASRPLGLRVFDGLRRRGRHAWRSLRGESQTLGAAAAMDWLLNQASPAAFGGNLGSIIAMLPVLSAYGQRETRNRLVQCLLSQQAMDGSFQDMSGRSCAILTGQALRELLHRDVCLHDGPLAKASHWLAASIMQDGSPAATAPGALLNWSSPALRLIPMAALARSGYAQVAEQAARELRRRHDLTQWNMPTHWFAPIVRAMLALGWSADARHALELPAALQRSTGEVPALPDVEWVSSAGLAELAICWQAIGEHERANAALAALRAHQSRGGGFAGSWGPGAVYYPQRQTISAACRFLEASLTQVSSSFARGGQVLDNTIDPADGRLLAVRDFLADLPPGSRVADVGCGSGRYLARLRQWFPKYQWTGIDVATSALSQLPPGVERAVGSLLNLPIAAGRFDAVYCVEALEHSLLPCQAVAELCRIVRAGGRLQIIDKHRRFQALSQHQPWEQWFLPADVANWLSPSCEAVACRPVPHGARPTTAGLFLSWTATRRALSASSTSRAA